jgi:hypothetical protein
MITLTGGCDIQEGTAFTEPIMQGNIHLWVGKGQIWEGTNICLQNGETWVIYNIYAFSTDFKSRHDVNLVIRLTKLVIWGIGTHVYAFSTDFQCGSNHNGENAIQCHNIWCGYDPGINFQSDSTMMFFM